MNTFEQECERLIKNANDAKNGDKKQEATNALVELNSVLETDEYASMREEANSRLGEKEYEKKARYYQRRHRELSAEVSKLRDAPKSKMTFGAEITKGAILWSTKHQDNVEVIEVKSDGTVVIRVTKGGKTFLDTVPLNDLSKKR